AKADALGGVGEIAPDADDLFGQLVDAGADLRAHLDDRLMHLALDRVAERRRARREQLLHVRAELPGRRVDDLEFLFDADREDVIHACDGPANAVPSTLLGTTLSLSKGRTLRRSPIIAPGAASATGRAARRL